MFLECQVQEIYRFGNYFYLYNKEGILLKEGGSNLFIGVSRKGQKANMPIKEVRHGDIIVN